MLFVVDVSVGLTDEDLRAAKLVRDLSVPVFLAVNKVDGASREPDIWDFTNLGLGEPWPISAIHGRLLAELLDAVIDIFPPADENEYERQEVIGFGKTDGVPAVAIAGRPNVGKSTLFNRLIGEERSVVHDVPGTTRDSIDTEIETDEGPIRFVDTAGMRRKSRIDEDTEYYSMVRALQSVDRADVCLFVIDATEGVTHQDQRLAERIDAAGSPIVVCLNKWELLDEDARASMLAQVEDRLAFLSYAPVTKISALSGLGVHKLLPTLRNGIEAYHRRIPTGELNRVIQSAQQAHAAPGSRILYATQGASDPPTFTLFTTKPLAPTYMRYLERKLREHFGFGPTPLKLRVRRRTAG